MKKIIHIILLAAATNLSGCAQLVADMICPGPGSGLTCTRDMAKEMGNAYSTAELLEKSFRTGEIEKSHTLDDINQPLYAKDGLVYRLQKNPEDMAAYAKLRQIAFDAHYTSDVETAGQILERTGTCTAMKIAADMVSAPWQGIPATPPLPAYVLLPHYDYPKDPPPSRETIRQTGYKVLNGIQTYPASPTLTRYTFDVACLQNVRSQLPPPPSGWKSVP
jgi:hypothetical protein